MNKLTQILGLLVILNACFVCEAQTKPPYTQDFETGPGEGWGPSNQNYAQSIGDWEHAYVSNDLLQGQRGVWVTNALGPYRQDLTSGLTSGYFNLSDTSVNWQLKVRLQIELWSGSNLRVNVNWKDELGKWQWGTLIPSNEVPSVNWPYGGVFSGDVNYSLTSQISLLEFRGVDSLRFVFNFTALNNSGKPGVLIDEFSIIEENDQIDIDAYKADTISGVVQGDLLSDLVIPLNVKSEYQDPVRTEVDIYWSELPILNSESVFVQKLDALIQFSSSERIDLLVPEFATSGFGYFVFVGDAGNEIIEVDELNNVGAIPVRVDTVYASPMLIDFEYDYGFGKVQDGIFSSPVTFSGDWDFGVSQEIKASGAHSGDFSAHATLGSKKVIFKDVPGYFDFSYDSLMISFWYKNFTPVIRTNKKNGQFYQSIAPEIKRTGDFWGFYSGIIPESWKSGEDLKLSVVEYLGNSVQDISGFDDFYLGPKLSDLTLREDYNFRVFSKDQSQIDFQLILVNSGFKKSETSVIQFFISENPEFSEGDQLVASEIIPEMLDTSELRMTVAIPNLWNASESHYLHYKIDPFDEVTEFHERNNEGAIQIFLVDELTAPFVEDFEASSIGWGGKADIGESVFVHQILSPAAQEWGHVSGKGLSLELPLDDSIRTLRTFVIAPVFDLSALKSPVLEFDYVTTNTIPDECEKFNVYAQVYSNLSSSSNNGLSWEPVVAPNESYNRWRGAFTNSFKEPFEPYLRHQSYQQFPDTTARFAVEISHLKGPTNRGFKFTVTNGVSSCADEVIIDNFSITEGEADLTFSDVSPLFLASNRRSHINLNLVLTNLGNLLSDSASIGFYLSENDQLDEGDFRLDHNVDFGSVKPYTKINIQTTLLGLPENSTQYSFLIVRADDFDQTIESNKLNNAKAYPLEWGGIVAPYTTGFEEDYLYGWRSFANGLNALTQDPRNWVFQNTYRTVNPIILPENKNAFFEDDNIYSSTVPEVFLESPAFDLSQMDSIFIFFNFRMSGNLDGDEFVQLQYLEPNTDEWITLGDQGYKDSLGENWYNYPNVGYDYGPGWTNCRFFEGVYYNATSLFSGRQDITFRIHAKSDGECGVIGSGVAIDNFTITESRPKSDLVAVTQNQSFTAIQSDSIPGIIEITNVGNVPTGHFTVNLNLYAKDYSDTYSDFKFDNLDPGDTLAIFLDDLEYAYGFHLCDAEYRIEYEITAYSFYSYETLFSDNPDNNKGNAMLYLPHNLTRFDSNIVEMSSNQPFCFGDEVSVSAQGPNFSYWTERDQIENPIMVSNSDTILAVFVDQNGCMDTLSLEFDFIKKSPKLQSTEHDLVGCRTEGMTLSVHPDFVPLLWSTSSTDKTIHVNEEDYYFANVITEEGCEFYTDTVYVEFNDPQGVNTMKVSGQFDGLIICPSSPPLLSTDSEYEGHIQWSNGDTSFLTSPIADELLYYSLQNECGTYFSDSLIFNSIEEPVGMVYLDSVICQDYEYELAYFGSHDSLVTWHVVSNVEEEIYFEDFTYFDGVTEDPSNKKAWVSEIVSGSSNATFEIQSNRLYASFIESEAVFETKEFDISDFDRVNAEVGSSSYSSNSSQELYTKVFYSVDDAAYQLFEVNGVLSGGYGAVNSIQSGIYGNTLRLKVVIHTDGYFGAGIDHVELTAEVVNKDSLVSREKSVEFIADQDALMLLEIEHELCPIQILQELNVDVEKPENIIYGGDYFECPGDNAFVRAHSLSGFSYYWSPDSLSEGIDDYALSFIADTSREIKLEIVHQKGCSYKDSIFLEVPYIPTPVIFEEAGVIQTIDYGNYDYYWGYNDDLLWFEEDHFLSQDYGFGTYELTLEQDIGFCSLDAEVYLHVDSSFTDCNGDIGGSAILDVCEKCAGGNTGVEPETNVGNCALGIGDLPIGYFYVYPTKSDGQFLIESTKVGPINWRLVNSLGVVVRLGDGVRMNVSDVPSGVYLLISEDHQTKLEIVH